MTTREDFEAWWKDFTDVRDDWRYADSDALRFQTWQAATAAALERAAEVCDGINADYTVMYVAARATSPKNLDYLDGASDGAEECAEAIRALKDADTC